MNNQFSGQRNSYTGEYTNYVELNRNVNEYIFRLFMNARTRAAKYLETRVLF